MGIIICQMCQRVIDYYKEEKVTTLYSTCCPNCNKKKKMKK